MRRRGAKAGARSVLGVLGILAASTGSAPLGAQTLQGRVTDDSDGQGVSVAVVRLLGPDGSQLSLAFSDSAGAYRLEAPKPGQYHVEAERLGYETTRSPLLGVADPEGTYPVDITMRKAPLGLEGLTVTADRLEKIEGEVRREVGLDPRSLRVAPIQRAEIEDHLAKAHDVTDLVRWENLPSVIVKETRDGPCFQYRQRGCIDVYMNGFKINPELVPVLPLGVVETVVVVLPGESIVYPAGGVLLYTPAWLGLGRSGR